MLGVAISGKLASGKTTAAQALIEEYGFTRVLLAGELKRVAGEIAEWLWRTFDPGKSDDLRVICHDFLRIITADMKDKTKPGGRKWLQFLGTEIGRSLLPTLWVQAMMSKIEREGLERVVVDDVRFKNEAEALRQVGFLMIRVEVPKDVQRARVAELYPEYDQSVYAHPSETDLDDYKPWHYTLDGGAPIGQFRAAALSVVRGVWADRLAPKTNLPHIVTESEAL